MQTNDEVKIDYILAQGPEGLGHVLTDLLEKNREAKKTGTAEYYLKYQLASQTSLIKVDLNAQPVQVWYYDLQGRAPTNSVKETIAKILSEKAVVTDVNRAHQDRVLENSIEPTDVMSVADIEQRANKLLSKLHAPVSVAKSVSSLFHRKPDETKVPPPSPWNSGPKRGR